MYKCCMYKDLPYCLKEQILQSVHVVLIFFNVTEPVSWVYKYDY